MFHKLNSKLKIEDYQPLWGFFKLYLSCSSTTERSVFAAFAFPSNTKDLFVTPL